MKSKSFFLSAFAIIILLTSQAQSTKSNTVSDKVFLGLGLGLDYGGIGLRSEFIITKNISIFGGAGYNLVDVAYNVGTIYNFLPEKRFCPTFLAMYGYNAAIKFKNRPDLSKSYYGVNLGVGCHIKDRDFKNRWALEVLFPFRSDAFEKDYDYYKPVLENKILPVTITIGRNFALRKKSK